MESPFDTILRLAKGIAKTGKKAVTELGNPDFGKSLGNEALNATKTGIVANTVLGIPRETVNTVKDIAQSVARTAVGFGGDVRNLTVPQEKRTFEVQPTGIAKTLLGPSPIKTISARVAENEQGIKNSPYAQSIGADKYALPLAFGGTVGMAALDLTPFGGEKNVLKTLVKSKDAQYISKVLRSLKVDEKLIPTLSQKIAVSTDEKVISNLLKKETTPVAKSFSDFHPDDQTTLTKYSEQVKSGRGVPIRDSQIVKETLESYGLKVPDDVRKVASQIDLMKTGAANAADEAFIKSIEANAAGIIKDGKKAVLQPRDISGRFDYIKKTPIANITAPSTKTSTRIITESVPKKKGFFQSIKDFPNKQGGFARVPDFFPGKKKSITSVDRLIAEGKVRVKRVGNRDVYEYKKGNNWQRARDEDSAVKYFEPKAEKVPSLSPELAQKKQIIEVRKEAIESNPLNTLTKYVAKHGEFKGRLPEVIGGQGGKFKKKGDDIITEVMGPNADSEAVRNQMDNFLDQKRAVAEAEKALNQEIKTQRYSREGIPLSTPASMKARSEGKSTKTVKGEGKTSSSPIEVMKGSTGEVRSLEKLAEQSATREILDPQMRKSFSLPHIIEKLPTPVKAKVNILDYLRTPENVLKKIGLHKQGEELRRGYDAYLKELPKNIDKITEWSKQVPKESNVRIFRYLDGQAIDLNPTELKVATEIKAWLAEWADRLGLPKDNRIANYITHLFDDQLIKKEFDEDLAKIIADKIPGSVYDPFLQKRLGARGYREDVWAALDAYVKRGTRKVHMDGPLASLENASTGLEESQWNFVKRFADRVNLRPTELDNMVDNGIKAAFGYRFGQRPVTTITSTLRRATYRGMLGLNVGSALRNLSQGINTYAKLGEKYTAIGYSKLFSPRNLAELKTEGVLNASFVQDRALSAAKKTMEKVDKSLFFFFETAEKINRGAAYFGAKAKGLSAGMTEAKAIEYAKKVVRETQFQFGSIDTPVGMSSDIVKTLTQFQTFTTKQIEFLAGMAKNKEYAGLIRYALSGLAFVYTIGQAFGMEPKDLLPIYRLGVPPSLKLPFEIISAGVDAPDEYGQARTPSEKAKDIANTLPGYIPAGIQAKKTIQGVKAIQEGGSYDKAGRLQFPQGESNAAKLQSVLFGKYASENAEGYFKKAEARTQEQAKIKPFYDEVQSLVAEGKEAEAKALIDSLSDSDYETYKDIKTTERAKRTLEVKKQVLPVYNQIQDLKEAGNLESAKSLVDAFSEEEYKAYQAIKKDKEKLVKAQNGEKPSFNPDEVHSDRGVVETVWTYAKAIGVDPVTAFNRIFTGQTIKYVSNGTVVVERLPLSASQAEKAAQGSAGPEVKLDHTVPLQLGGSNEKSNLKLVPTEVWASYTPIENALGVALRSEKITKKVAQSLMADFKEGKLTAEDVYNSIQQ